MTEIQSTVANILDKVKPEGARWVVYINDTGYKSTYGPFDSYDEAQAWIDKQASAHGPDTEVLPLYGAA